MELLAGNLDAARKVLEPLLGHVGVPLEEQRRTRALWGLLSGVRAGEPFSPLNGPGSYLHGWDGEGRARARQAWWGEAVKLG